MKGRYHIIVQNRRIKFEFDIRRSITIIRGDSATGKTTLMSLIETHERLGDESGITISCARKCETLNNSNWESKIGQSHESIIFIDEETRAVRTDEFAGKIRNSDNYYVIITRENLPNLPYAVEEVYGIHTSGKYAGVRQTYNSFYRLYTSRHAGGKGPAGQAELVVVEDTNAGYEFFSNLTKDRAKCISAGGKTKIKRIVYDNKGKKMLVIADGAAFGPDMWELYLYIQSNPEVSLYLPESFEWIILSSGLIDGNRIADVIENPENHIESSEFSSWERYFTRLLTDEAADSHLEYSKKKLNRAYLNEKEKAALLGVMNVIKAQLGQ